MKIEVMVGCSGSGKSTFAHEQWEKDPHNTVIVNRDKIRELLYGYTESTVSEYYSRNDVHKMEKQVTLFEDTLIHDALNLGKTVYVDATHLEKKYLERFRFFNVETNFTSFNVPLDLLIERDSNRVRKVGEEVIKKQFNKLSILTIPSPFVRETLGNPITSKKIYIVDIDGTVADKGNRSPFDWGSVLEDTPKIDILRVVDSLYASSDCDIMFCSGRDEVCFDDTKRWLYNYTELPWSEINLFMRKTGDVRPDWIVKEEMWRKFIDDGYHIVALIDDRNQVVRRARSLGLSVLQVDYGNF